MKKLGIVFAVLLVVLMAVLVIGTLGFRSKQIPAAPVGVMEISAASIDHLAEAVKFKTISYEEEQTSLATVFSGGIKDNVLPTEARAVVNFRIIPGETVATVLEHAKNVVADDRVTIAVRENATEPSPVSDVNSPAFRTIQKTIAEVFPDALAAPGLMVGATDARHYTSLSGNIFRFNPVRLTSEDLKRPHGINERISVENYRNAIRFFHRLIMNAAK